MGVEIERKFLVQRLPEEAATAEREAIQQGYLAIEPKGQEVRLRQQGERYTLTCKSSGTLTRCEYEIELSAAQFQTLWPTTEGRQLRKERLHLLRADYKIDLDCYEQPLNGLLLAEVEFSSEAAARAFEPEPWMGQEVTALNLTQNRQLLDLPDVEALKALL